MEIRVLSIELSEPPKEIGLTAFCKAYFKKSL